MTHAPAAAHRPRPARGYTLVELFLTVAVLMMLLGLVINLANRLRADSLERQTRRQLQRLAAAIDLYATTHDGRSPEATPLVDPTATTVPAEAALQAAAARNADDVRRGLGWPPPPPPAADHFRDPWGTPLVFMPRQNPAVGMAPGDQPFFVSAGPDRQFLTRADNLYTYDYADDRPPAASSRPDP